jgi:enoyl-CoA hydratase/carnithine racemase
MLRQIVGDRAATDMIYRGEFMASSEAQKIGLVDEVVSEDKVEARAVEKVEELAALPRQAFDDLKDNRVQAVRTMYDESFKSKHEY